MAERPVFCSDPRSYVRTVNTTFTYFGGFAKVQRQKCIRGLHDAFLAAHPERRLLEISSYSQEPLGFALSAFHLTLTLSDGSQVPVELAYQASKIFERGGPYTDLLKVAPGIAKKDPRLTESGRVIGFSLEGREFPAYPVTLFYTWLYIHALAEHPELADPLCGYDAFTDIVFNPKKSVSCQAGAAAVYVSLRGRGELDRALNDMDFLAEVLSHGAPVRSPAENNAGGRKRVPSSSPAGSEAKTLYPSIFKKGDVIHHPTYGEGTVAKVTPMQKTAVLEVNFMGVGKKTLDESWVRQHCRLTAADPADAPDGYEEIADTAVDGSRFTLYQSRKHPLSRQMLDSLARLTGCMESDLVLAVVGDDVFTALFPGECDSFGDAAEGVVRSFRAVLGNHPDFEVMDAGGDTFLVTMQGRVVCVVPNETGDTKLPFPAAITKRQNILDSCERGIIYGFAVGRDYRGASGPFQPSN